MRTTHVLLVEDNEGDILLTTEVLEESGITRITVIRDGKSAIDFFEKTQASSHPDLILLDINLPKKSGHEVLEHIKNSKIYNHIPVIMLTTSSSGKDILLAYQHFANCYITKPVDFFDFTATLNKFNDFWLNVASIVKL